MKRKLFVAGIFVFGFLAVANAENAKKDSGLQLDQITVTAQKTEENLRDVPVSVSVFEDFVLEDEEIKDLGDLSYYVPNFFLQYRGEGSGGGSASPSMRGLYASAGSSVGLYVDGMPTTSSVGFTAIMNGVERVEVLRGPQGTLYGKNAQAGVINIITKKPDNELEGQVYGELGEDNKHEVGVGLSTPIVKNKFYIGFTGKFYEKDGYVENTYLDNIANDHENYYGKLYLRLTPSDRLDISLISSTYEADFGAQSRNLVSAGKLREIQSDINQTKDFSLDTYALNITYQFDNFTIESITSYQEKELGSLTDMDFSSEKLRYMKVDIPYETLAQELRLKGERGRLKWLAGLYADSMEKTGGYSLTSTSPSYIMMFNSDVEENTSGIFGHLTYQLTDRFSVTFGLRYDNDHREIRHYGLDVYEKSDYNAFSPKFALQYKINNQITTYATVAKGYKSGGFYVFAAEGYPVDYGQETLWNYEIGVKSVLMDNRLMLNAAAYYMDISDMQVITNIDNKFGYISNAASAHSTGFELEGKYILNENFSTFTNLGICESKFDDFSDAGGDYDGNYNTYAPVYNYAVGLKFRGVGGLFASATVNGYGKSYLDKANQCKHDAYELVKAKIGYEWEHVDFYVYGNNIFDEKYDLMESRFAYLSDPGELGVRLTWRF